MKTDATVLALVVIVAGSCAAQSVIDWWTREVRPPGYPTIWQQVRGKARHCRRVARAMWAAAAEAGR